MNARYVACERDNKSKNPVLCLTTAGQSIFEAILNGAICCRGNNGKVYALYHVCSIGIHQGLVNGNNALRYPAIIGRSSAS